MDEISSKSLRYTKRWFSYFDLLGFKNLVLNNRIERVLPIYEDVLKVITRKADPKKSKGLSYSWFSDTFILFTKGSSDKEFALIEQASRLFFQNLILKEIPVRGSLTIGDLYSLQKKNIFLGKALIDAYEYGEKQNWLGFVLTPSVHAHLKGSSLELERRAFYRHINDPSIITHSKPDNVFAYAFNNGEVNGRNPFLKAIQSMKAQAGKDYEKKYINTENFIARYEFKRP